MSTNPPDTKNENNDKKDGACEINNKLVHGTPRRRKIIKAKRPPMSKMPPTPCASASDTTPKIPPPADGELSTCTEDAKTKTELELLLEGWGIEEGNLRMDDDFIKSLDPEQVKQLVRVGLDNPRIRKTFSGVQEGKLDQLKNMDGDQLKSQLLLGNHQYDGEHYIYRHQLVVPQFLVKVRFDPSIREVGRNIFSRSGTTLKEVVLNEGLLKLDSEAFSGFDALEEVIMPSTVKFIESSAFSRCYQLGKVVLNEGLLQLGEWSFEGCINLESVAIPSTLKCIDGYTFSGCVNLQEVSFGTGIESISHSAFAGCRSLKQVVFNKGLKEIGKDSFWNASNLDKVVMNETNIQSIHCNAFRGCSLLRKIKLQSLSTRLSNIVQAGNTQIEGKLNSFLGFYLGCEDEEIYLNAQAYASGGAGQPDLNLWKQIKENYLGRIDDMLSFYERKEATIIFELAWWKNKVDNPEEDSPVSREECRTDIPGPAKDAIWQYLPCASSFEDDSNGFDDILVSAWV